MEGKLLSIIIRQSVFILLYANPFFIILLVTLTYTCTCSFSLSLFDIILDFNIFSLLSFKNYLFEF